MFEIEKMLELPNQKPKKMEAEHHLEKGVHIIFHLFRKVEKIYTWYATLSGGKTGTYFI